MVGLVLVVFANLVPKEPDMSQLSNIPYSIIEQIKDPDRISGIFLN